MMDVRVGHSHLTLELGSAHPGMRRRAPAASHALIELKNAPRREKPLSPQSVIGSGSRAIPECVHRQQRDERTSSESKYLAPFPIHIPQMMRTAGTLKPIHHRRFSLDLSARLQVEVRSEAGNFRSYIGTKTTTFGQGYPSISTMRTKLGAESGLPYSPSPDGVNLDGGSSVPSPQLFAC